MRIARETTGRYDPAFLLGSIQTSFEVVIESRGGASKTSGVERNPEYIPALEALLGRVQSVEGVLLAAYIDSETVAEDPLEERLLEPPSHNYPIQLASVEDLFALRKEIGRALADYGSKRKGGGGNATKRMRMVFQIPGSDLEINRILDILQATE